jgi:hypothetical protein
LRVSHSGDVCVTRRPSAVERSRVRLSGLAPSVFFASTTIVRPVLRSTATMSGPLTGLPGPGRPVWRISMFGLRRSSASAVSTPTASERGPFGQCRATASSIARASAGASVRAPSRALSASRLRSLPLRASCSIASSDARA